MTEHDTTHGASSSDPAGASAPRDEWEDVKRSLDELASAMTKWATAVKDDPENRRQAREIQERFETMGRDMGKAIDSAADSDFVRGMTDAAGKAGEAVVDAARTVGREVRPFMATAFRTAAEGMRVVAEKVEDSAERRASSAAQQPVGSDVAPPPRAAHPHPAPQPAPYTTGVEPPAPAPSGTPGQHKDADPGEH